MLAVIGLAGTLALPMGFSSVALAVLGIVWLVRLLRREISSRDLPVDAAAYLAVYGWRALTLVVNGAWRGVRELKGVFNRLPYLFIGALPIPARTVVSACHVVFAAYGLVVLYGLAQRHLDAPVLYKPLFWAHEYRLHGYAGHPNQFAGGLSLVLILNLSLGMVHRPRWLLYTPLLAVGLAASGSRSYLLGVTVAFLALVCLASARRAAVTALAAAAAAGGLLAVSLPELLTRLEWALSVERNARRLNFWRVSWEAFLAHPVFGVGAGNLPAYLEPARLQGLIDNALQAHSVYLQELAEGGVVGFGLVIGTLVYFAVKYAAVARQTSEPLLRAAALAVALGIVNVLVAGVFEDTLGAAIVARTLHFLMGLVEGHRRFDARTGLAGSAP
jgi:O-antigen ligase